MSQKIVIVGGGFGGITAAKGFKHPDFQVTLIDKANDCVLQPFLYQVATASLSQEDVTTPIRESMRRQTNVSIVEGKVISIDAEKKQVNLDHILYCYDYLILATGSQASYYGRDEFQLYAPCPRTLPDALKIRDKLLQSFKQAEQAKSREKMQKLITFAIVGGGPIGVEVAGALAELSRKALSKKFIKTAPCQVKIVLLEALDRILTAFDPRLSQKARLSLEQMGIEVRLNASITGIDEKGVWLGEELIETSNIIWAGGARIPPLSGSLNAETDGLGRVLVKSDCSLSNHPEVFVIGDAARFIQNGKPLPMLAPVAVQQGEYVARVIQSQASSPKRRPFRYIDRGIAAIIGRGSAVIQIRSITLSGFLTWVLWLLVHLRVFAKYGNSRITASRWFWRSLTGQHEL
jgi:NADH dehydrogenase